MLCDGERRWPGVGDGKVYINEESRVKCVVGPEEKWQLQRSYVMEQLLQHTDWLCGRCRGGPLSASPSAPSSKAVLHVYSYVCSELLQAPPMLGLTSQGGELEPAGSPTYILHTAPLAFST